MSHDVKHDVEQFVQLVAAALATMQKTSTLQRQDCIAETPRAEAVAVAMIHWRITVKMKRGAHLGLDEIALQRWRAGQIVSERFIDERLLDLNDPADRAQFAAARPAP